MTFQPKWKNASGTPTYRSWNAMRGRCLCKSNASYARYGARGITICARWESYDTFIQDMGPRPVGMTLERKNSEENYQPENCRWATPTEQQSNTSTNKKLTFNGKTQTLEAWARELKWSDTSVIRYRLNKNEPLSRVLTRASLRQPASHGSRAKYNSGCRCFDCKNAQRVHDRQRKLKVRES